jgi:hypothetical protein
MVAHLFVNKECRQSTLTRFAEQHRAVDAMIRGIYENRVALAARRTAYQEKIRCAYATVKSDSLACTALHRLLNDIGRRTDWLGIEPAVPFLGPQPGNTFLDSLLMLALRHTQWQGEPELWQSVAGSPRQQFGAFVRHLFPGYDVPAFLDAAWFEGFTQHGESHRAWFLHIRSGHNIRTADVPVPLTSMAAHHFLQAPENGSIVAALRWGQTLALGGDAHLARAIAESRLADILPDEPFWHSVIHFFANHSEIPPNRVGPLVDYIHARKFGEASDFSAVPEPGFSMKGRTPTALQKRMEEWHELLAKEAKRPSVSWEPSGILPFTITERDVFGATNDWTVLELTTNKALQEEGSEMRNCVRTYAEGCQRGTTSIWSLRIRSGRNARFRSLLTIEVNNARRAIVQVRGMCNKSLPSMRHSPRMKIAEGMLLRWARESRLSIACTL